MFDNEITRDLLDEIGDQFDLSDFTLDLESKRVQDNLNIWAEITFTEILNDLNK